MKNAEWADKRVEANAKLFLDMTESVTFLFAAAYRNKQVDGWWYRALAFPSGEAATKFLELGWTYRVLCTEGETVWLVLKDGYAAPEPFPKLLMA